MYSLLRFSSSSAVISSEMLFVSNLEDKCVVHERLLHFIFLTLTTFSTAILGGDSTCDGTGTLLIIPPPFLSSIIKCWNNFVALMSETIAELIFFVKFSDCFLLLSGLESRKPYHSSTQIPVNQIKNGIQHFS